MSLLLVGRYVCRAWAAPLVIGLAAGLSSHARADDEIEIETNGEIEIERDNGKVEIERDNDWADELEEFWEDIEDEVEDVFDDDVERRYDVEAGPDYRRRGVGVDIDRDRRRRSFDLRVNVDPWVDVRVRRGAVSDRDIIVETRGPVHEAFAEPIVFDPAPGLIVPKRPPELVEEIPPDQRPEGENVTWIPGYWAWDFDRSDFIWVSGIWRNIPPGRQFVPGYWRQVNTGYQWISGFWLSARLDTVEYLPPPPESLETGPAGDPPQPHYVWVPGVWLYREDRYVWRPGYWLEPQQNWAWVPAHYVWAPAGHVFVSGYWDYDLARRGVLFAPVYLARPMVRPVYQPSIVVNGTVLMNNLFARPRYDHYYFGDYYSRDYFQAGVYPVFAFQQSSYGYSPLFAAYLSRQPVARADVFARFREDYRLRRDNPNYRPPRTWTAMQDLRRRPNLAPQLASQLALAEPLDRIARRTDLPFRFRSLQPDSRADLRQSIAQARDYQEQRRRVETQDRLTGIPVGPSTEPRLDTPRPQPRIETPRPAPGVDQEVAPRMAPPTPEGRRARPPANVRVPGQDQRRLDSSRTGQEERQRGVPQRVQEARRAQPGQPLRLNLPRSPLTGRPDADQRFAPPPRPRAAPPDPSIQPGTRVEKRREPKVD